MAESARAVRRGTVTNVHPNRVQVRFESQRCTNCTCGFGLLTRAQPATVGENEAHAGELLEVPIALVQDVGSGLLQPGQPVRLSVGADGLARVGVALFGLPVVLALAGGLFGEAPGALAGLLCGCALSWLARRQMQTKIYESMGLHGTESGPDCGTTVPAHCHTWQVNQLEEA